MHKFRQGKGHYRMFSYGRGRGDTVINYSDRISAPAGGLHAVREGATFKGLLRVFFARGWGEIFCSTKLFLQNLIRLRKA